MSTVCAISTPPGIGGIAVIRVSGPKAIAIAERLTGKSLTQRVHFCPVSDLDDLIVTLFPAPHSFTGEDTVEFSCHGSRYVQQELLQRLLDLGCVMAQPGEFTKRAFLNGKLDLSQAEAVADVIASQSKAENDLALHHLRGGISTELAALREQLLRLTSLLELELDFADHEELEFADRSELLKLCTTLRTKLSTLLSSFKAGNAIRNGIGVAIIGATNVGKSTLLNALLGEQRAIVSDVQGTTRDTVEDTMMLGGYMFRFIDTAGLRETSDVVESLGIERSRQAADKADIIVYVQDATNLEGTTTDLSTWSDKPIVHIHNKCDLLPSTDAHQVNGVSDSQVICLCAQSGCVDPLRERLVELASELCSHQGDVIISNARHAEALQHALDAIGRVQEGLQAAVSAEFVSMDLHDCLDALGSITGHITSDEVLANIFRHFCIGK